MSYFKRSKFRNCSIDLTLNVFIWWTFPILDAEHPFLGYIGTGYIIFPPQTTVMTKSKPSAKAQGKVASLTRGKKTKEDLLGKRDVRSNKENIATTKSTASKTMKPTESAKSNKEDDATISKTIKREIVEQKLYSGSAKSNEEIFAAEIKRLTAENAALRQAKAMQETVGPMIPRPEKGSAGNGYNLQSKMGLDDNDQLYGTLRRSVRAAVNRSGLDYRVHWHRQPKHIVSQVIAMVRQRHDYFDRFTCGWPIEDFIKSSLKNKRSYARKHGHFEEVGNTDNAKSDDDPKESLDDDMRGDVDNNMRNDEDQNMSGSERNEEGDSDIYG